MGYRKLEDKPHHHNNRYTQNISVPSDVWMENGSTIDLAFPCFYRIPCQPQPRVHHCRDWHDFVGQPTPDHPDHVFQPPHHHHHGHPWVNGPHCNTITKKCKTIPIHLTDEGYDKFTIDFDSESGITGTCKVDDKLDHILRVHISANVSDLKHHIDKERIIRYTIRAYITEANRTDVVVVGHIHVLPDVLNRG